MVSPRDTIDAAIAKGVEAEIKKRSWNAQALCQFTTLVSDLITIISIDVMTFKPHKTDRNGLK